MSFRQLRALTTQHVLEARHGSAGELHATCTVRRGLFLEDRYADFAGFHAFAPFGMVDKDCAVLLTFVRHVGSHLSPSLGRTSLIIAAGGGAGPFQRRQQSAPQTLQFWHEMHVAAPAIEIGG